MSRTLLSLFAVLALATCLALAQDQPAQNQTGQAQSMPQTQQPPQSQAKAHGQTGMSSEALQAAFQRTFAHYPQLSNVNATVSQDKVELSGTVASQADKDKLRRMVEDNADGRKVSDEKLTVAGSDRQANPPTTSEKPPTSEKPMSEKPPVPPTPPIPPR